MDTLIASAIEEEGGECIVKLLEQVAGRAYFQVQFLFLTTTCQTLTFRRRVTTMHIDREPINLKHLICCSWSFHGQLSSTSRMIPPDLCEIQPQLGTSEALDLFSERDP